MFWFKLLFSIFGLLCSGAASFASPDSTNTMASGIMVNGEIDFSNMSSGTVSNTLDTLTANDNAVVNFSNTGSGSTTNTIRTLSVVGNGASLNLSNSGIGSSVNNIETMSVSNGNVFLGGADNVTAISNLNWSGGEIDLLYANGGFGTTSIQNLNITEPVTIAFYDSSHSLLTPSSLSSAQTVFSVNSFTGDPSQLSNANSFVQVLSTDYPSGITLTPDGHMYINLIPVGASYLAERGKISVDASSISLIQGGVKRAIKVKNMGTQLVEGIGVTINTPVLDISVVKNTCSSLDSGNFCEIIFKSGRAYGKTKVAITSPSIVSPVFLDVDVIPRD